MTILFGSKGVVYWKLSNRCKLWENWYSERHNFLKGINEISPVFTTFLSNLNKFGTVYIHKNILIYCGFFWKVVEQWKPCFTLFSSPFGSVYWFSCWFCWVKGSESMLLYILLINLVCSVCWSHIGSFGDVPHCTREWLQIYIYIYIYTHTHTHTHTHTYIYIYIYTHTHTHTHIHTYIHTYIYIYIYIYIHTYIHTPLSFSVRCEEFNKMYITYLLAMSVKSNSKARIIYVHWETDYLWSSVIYIRILMPQPLLFNVRCHSWKVHWQKSAVNGLS